MTFDINWENKIYKKNRQTNDFPFDWVVSSVNKYIPKRKKNIAVELGCGTGNNLEFLSNYGYSKTIGIDGSLSAIKYGKKKIKKNKKIHLINADFTNTFFEKVDLFLDRGSITCNEKKDIDKIFKNVFSQLNPDGFFFSSLCSKKHDAFKDRKGKKFFAKSMKISTGITASFFNENEVRNLFKKFELISLTEEIKYDKINNSQTCMWNVISKKRSSSYFFKY